MLVLLNLDMFAHFLAAWHANINPLETVPWVHVSKPQE